jgi:hypothetical protein
MDQKNMLSIYREPDVRSKALLVREEREKILLSSIVYFLSRILPNWGYMILRRHIPAILLSLIAFLAVPALAQVFRGYYSDSALEYEKKSKRKGVVKAYYPDSAIKCIVEYRKGELDGDVKEYYANGLLKMEMSYDDGERDGLAKFYYESGLLMAKVRFRHGREVGRSRFYDEHGMRIESPEHRRKAKKRLVDFIEEETVLGMVEERE